MLKKILFNFFLIFFIFSINFLYAETIFGKPKIIDADTLKINSKKIRLFGIDAPELNQKCKKIYLSIFIFNFKKEYNCGVYATNKVKSYLKNNNLKCVSSDKDKYGRYIAICYFKDKDINSWIVKNGLAVAYRRYSKKYITEEKYAIKNSLGIWSGNFENPELWRKKNK